MAKTVADMLVERLIDWGIDTIFGDPGDGINGVFQALRTNQDKLNFIQVRKVFMDVAVYNQRIMGPGHVYNVVDEAN